MGIVKNTHAPFFWNNDAIERCIRHSTLVLSSTHCLRAVWVCVHALKPDQSAYFCWKMAINVLFSFVLIWIVNREDVTLALLWPFSACTFHFVRCKWMSMASIVAYCTQNIQCVRGPCWWRCCMMHQQTMKAVSNAFTHRESRPAQVWIVCEQFVMHLKRAKNNNNNKNNNAQRNNGKRTRA